ncbi:MAG: urease subunit beta [Thermodesulfobacteriota bacterium]
MRLAPRDVEKLILHNAGFLAQKRYARGLKLNYVESMALIASQLQEFIRDGHSVADLMNLGKQILGSDDVLPDVPYMVAEVQVEGTFPDGTKLVTVHNPICQESGDAALALYGSGLTRAASSKVADDRPSFRPGELILAAEDIILNHGRGTVTIEVINRGDRPVQVGSHYPFFEANPSLDFDRARTWGFRLNIPSGAAVRFEPGETKTVELVELAGEKKVYGGHGLTSGEITEAALQVALQKARERGFEGVDDE